MQLKKSYYIATNICSRNSATTFGDLPDCITTIGLRGTWWRHQMEMVSALLALCDGKPSVIGYWPFVRGIHRSPVDSPHKAIGHRLLALCKGNPPVTGGFPSQSASNAGFDVSFDVKSKQTVKKKTVETLAIWDAYCDVIVKEWCKRSHTRKEAEIL